MTIDLAVKKALSEKIANADFALQLKSNREFQVRMEKAGVTTRKQSFTIPLMERIVHQDA